MNEIKKSHYINLTGGSIGTSLIMFALPLLGASLVQQLYNTVDLLFVGNFLSAESYAAVGASSLISTFFVVFFTGMSVGSNVIISQAMGNGNKKNILNSMHTSISLSLAGRIILTILGVILAPTMLRTLNIAPKIMIDAVTYPITWITSSACMYLLYRKAMKESSLKISLK